MGRVPTALTDKRVAGFAYIVCINTMRFMLSSCFPSRTLEFWYVLSRGCLGNKPPNKNPVYCMAHELPQKTTFHRCCHSWGNETYIVRFHRRELLEAWLSFLHILPMCLFLCRFCFGSPPCIKRSRAYDCMLMYSPVSPPSKSLNLGWLVDP